MRFTTRLLLALFLWLTVLAPTRAGGPVTLAGPNGTTPVVYPDGGQGLVLNYDQGDLGSRTNAQADSLVSTATNLWNDVVTATVSLQQGADLPEDVTVANIGIYFAVFNDGLNPIIYDTDGTITDALLGSGASGFVLGFARSAYFSATANFVEGESVINGSISLSDTRLKTVFAHEMGHFFGLDHTQLDSTQELPQSNYPLMYPIAFRASDSLHEDDVSAVSGLYPESDALASFGTLSGVFVDTDGTTPILGANIWVMETTTGKVYSSVSDFLTEGDGYFELLLPPGTYSLHAESIQTNFTGGSSVGPHSETASSPSFQPPHPITPVSYGGDTFTIAPGCLADLVFRLDGTGLVMENDCTNQNQAPTITSSPVTVALSGLLYAYDVEATDPDPGDTLAYSLTTGPAGMTIDSLLGLIQWTPTPGQTDDHSVTVRVEDAGGLFDTQTYTVTVNSASFSDNFNDGTLSPWSTLQSGMVAIVDDGSNGGVLRKTTNNDPNGGSAPLGAAVTDFELSLYSRRVDRTGKAANRYSVTNSAGNGYGLYTLASAGTLVLERRDGFGGTILTEVPLPGGVVTGQWYTLRLVRQGTGVNADIYLGRVDPSSSTPIVSLSATSSTHTSFTQINVNGGFVYDTDNVALVDLSAPAPLSIVTTTVPPAVINAPYSTILSATGGSGSYSWSEGTPALPGFLTLSAGGVLSGTPNATGSFPFEVVVDDGVSTANQTLTLQVSETATALFSDNFNDGTLSPWSTLQSGMVAIVDDGSNGGVLRKTTNNDPNGGSAPLGAAVTDFELSLYSRRVDRTGKAANRYSVTNSAGNGYGLYTLASAGTLVLERRDGFGGTILTEVPLPGGVVTGQWYTLRLVRQGTGVSADIYLGRVDPSSSTPIVSLSATSSTHTSFTQINVNGGFVYDTDNVALYEIE